MKKKGVDLSKMTPIARKEFIKVQRKARKLAVIEAKEKAETERKKKAILADLTSRKEQRQLRVEASELHNEMVAREKFGYFAISHSSKKTYAFDVKFEFSVEKVELRGKSFLGKVVRVVVTSLSKGTVLHGWSVCSPEDELRYNPPRGMRHALDKAMNGFFYNSDLEKTFYKSFRSFLTSEGLI